MKILCFPVNIDNLVPTQSVSAQVHMFTVHLTKQLKGGKDILETAATHVNNPIIVQGPMKIKQVYLTIFFFC